MNIGNPTWAHDHPAHDKGKAGISLHAGGEVRARTNNDGWAHIMYNKEDQNIHMLHGGGFGMHINTRNNDSDKYALELHNRDKPTFKVHNDGEVIMQASRGGAWTHFNHVADGKNYIRGETVFDKTASVPHLKVNRGDNEKYVPGWGNGVHAWDVYANGTIGAGIDGNVAAFLNRNGDIQGNSVSVNNNGALQFGHGYDREGNAGQISYGRHDGGQDGSLNIVGAGKGGQARTVRIWDRLSVGGEAVKLNYDGSHYLRGPTHLDGDVYIQPWNAWFNKGWDGHPSISFENESELRLHGNGGANAHLRVDGWVGAHGGLHNWSDARIKKDIANLQESDVNKLNQLQPKTFVMKKDETNRKRMGFIAQDVEKVYPHLVQESKDGIKMLNTVDLIPVLTQNMQNVNKQVRQDKLCIDDVCLTKNDIMRLKGMR
jgi:hypothetical protein